MTRRVREFLVAVLAIISVASLLLAGTYAYVSRSFFNADVFATRVADGLSQPALAGIVAGQLSDQIIAARRDLLPYRPIIVASVERVVGSAPFRAMVQKAVRETHKAILSETGENIALTVSDAGVIVRDALANNPEIAEKIPPRALAVLTADADWPNGKLLAKVLHISHRVRTRGLIVLLIGLISGAGGFALSRRKDHYLLRCGLGIAIAAFVIGIAARFGGPLVASLARTEFASQLIGALWPAFIGPLGMRMWVLAGMGLVLVAGVTSTLHRVDINAVAAWLWHKTEARPQRGLVGLARAIALVAVGGLAAFNPTLSLQILVVAASGILFFFGVQEVFVVLTDWLPEVEAAVAAATGKRRSKTPPVAAAAVLGTLVLAAGLYWYVRADRQLVPPAMSFTCNGHPELCLKRFNEVAFATTHNSMSAGDIADWMFPNQEKGIRTQLEDGIRGFLIDIHYGVPVGDRVKTLLEDETVSMAKYEEALGKEAVEAAMRARDRMVGKETGERDVYLGHGFCELGATKFVTALEQMYDFLVMNPGEVVIIVVQDEGVAPLDVAECFTRSGLEEMVYRGPVTGPWPTLREMIALNQRVVVLAENNTEGVPWYHRAFDVCQETPYVFKTPEDFSNKPNRGGKSGTLLLMNHWIETTPTPLPSNAEIVNAYDFLLARARACKKQRRMMPNLVAVDFYRSGDVVRVVDALNGVEAPAALP